MRFYSLVSQILSLNRKMVMVTTATVVHSGLPCASQRSAQLRFDCTEADDEASSTASAQAPPLAFLWPQGTVGQCPERGIRPGRPFSHRRRPFHRDHRRRCEDASHALHLSLSDRPSPLRAYSIYQIACATSTSRRTEKCEYKRFHSVRSIRW